MLFVLAVGINTAVLAEALWIDVRSAAEYLVDHIDGDLLVLPARGQRADRLGATERVADFRSELLATGREVGCLQVEQPAVLGEPKCGPEEHLRDGGPAVNPPLKQQLLAEVLASEQPQKRPWRVLESLLDVFRLDQPTFFAFFAFFLRSFSTGSPISR